MSKKRLGYLDYLLATGNQDEYEAELEQTRRRRQSRSTPREETLRRMEREEALEQLLGKSSFDPNFDLE